MCFPQASQWCRHPSALVRPDIASYWARKSLATDTFAPAPRRGITFNDDECRGDFRAIYTSPQGVYNKEDRRLDQRIDHACDDEERYQDGHCSDHDPEAVTLQDP